LPEGLICYRPSQKKFNIVEPTVEQLRVEVCAFALDHAATLNFQ
jgi:hypothetical protein